MTPEQVIAACCITAITGWKLCGWLINRGINRRIKAYTARRAQLERDLAAYRDLLAAGIEQQAGDPYSDDRIDLERMFIPTQRQPRTEDNQ